MARTLFHAVRATHSAGPATQACGASECGIFVLRVANGGSAERRRPHFCVGDAFCGERVEDTIWRPRGSCSATAPGDATRDEHDGGVALAGGVAA